MKNRRRGPLEAGRELDALVAEKVMGLDVRSTHSDYDPTFTSREVVAGHEALMRLTSGDPKYFLPHYSTNMEAAWPVVEKLHEQGHAVSVATYSLYGCSVSEYRWQCVMAMGVRQVAHEVAPTAPYAICLAALKAVGVAMDRG